MYQRIITSLLALTLFIQPIAPAFAQEASGEEGADTSSSDTSADTATTESTAEIVTDDSSLISPESALSAPQTAQQSQSSQAGSASGDAETVVLETVSSFDGSFSYDYPLALPPGRNGMQPDLSLSYSSGRGSDHDQFGYGWSINIPYVQRINKYGVENLYTGTSSYFSSLSGELVRVGTSNTYRAKVETGDFLIYTLSANTWTATNKAGVVYTFGSAASTRQNNAASSSQVYKWMVDDVRDQNGNYISYSYAKDQGAIYPDEIDYTKHASTSAHFNIEFNRELKTGSSTSYAPGFQETTRYRTDEIIISAGATWVKKYALGYTTGDNGARDVLLSITLTGQEEDGSSTKSLPATNFAYQSATHNLTNYTNDYDDSLPEYLYDETSGYPDQGVEMFDVNGDGLTDFADADKGEPAANRKVYINDGDEWVYDSSWTLPAGNFSFAYRGGIPTDVNGDGLTDLFFSFKTSGWEDNIVYLNTGSGWTQDTTWSNSIPGTFRDETASVLEQGYTLGDVNGDGLPDILFDADGGSGSNYVYINTGNAWELDTSWDIPDADDFTFINRAVTVADVNGDGLADFIHSLDAGASLHKDVYLNDGTGDWTISSQWSDSLPSTYFVEDYSSYEDFGYRVFDINGDNLNDLVRLSGSTKEVHLNTGMGWTSTSFTFASSNEFYFSERNIRPADVNGDGITDLVFAKKTSSWNDKYVYLNQGLNADLMAEVEEPMGGARTAHYTGSAQLGDADDSRHNPDLPFTLPVVTAVVTDNQFGNVATTTYDYFGGAFYATTSDIRDRKFAGFSRITAIDDLASTTRYFHQNNGNDSATNETGDSEARIGFTYRTDIEDLSGNLYQRTVTNFNDTDLGDGATFVAQSEAITADYDGDGDYKAAAIAYAYSTTTGNPSTITEYGEGTVSGATFTDTGTDKRTIEYTYAASGGSDVRSAVSEEHIKDNSASTVSRTKFYYDGLAHGSIDEGNLTKQEAWVTGSTYVDSQWTYDVHGLPTTATDPRNNDTDFIYDTHALYVSTTTDAENLETITTHDYSSGQLVRQTEPSGAYFDTTYDPIDRPEIETIPDPATGNPTTKTVYRYTDTRDAFRIETEHKINASDIHSVFVYQDGFGQPIQERTRAEASNTYAVRDFDYGDNGLLEQESLPYFDTGTSRSTATTDTDLYTTYGYDALSRVIAATTTVGTTNTSYDQWLETVTDPLGNQKDFSRDAFGRLAGVTEYNNASTYDTDYEWDGNDNLTKITDDLGNVRNITYDGLSRRTKLEDLHATADTTFGSTTFAYDATGNLTSRMSPNGDVTNWTYDDANRPLTENFTGVAGTEITYTYDTCTNGDGLLCSAVGTDAMTTYTYTPNGLIASETKTIDGTGYTTEYEYDRQANQTLVTYPDDSEVRYTFNEANLLEKVEQRESGGSFVEVVSNFDYGAHQLVTFMLQGNNASTTRVYDANALYRLTAIHTEFEAPTGGAGEEHQEIEMMLSLESPASSTLVYASDAVPIAEPDTTNETTDGTTEDQPLVAEAITASSSDPKTTATTTLKATATETILEPVLEETATTEPAAEAIVSPAPIAEKLIGKSALEVARIKGREIAKHKDTLIGTHRMKQLKIEIIDVEAIDEGVQVFARAWHGGKQYGFGNDGSVDIERFVIVNPLLKILDEDNTYQYELDGETFTTYHSQEDPVEALLQSLQGAIEGKKQKYDAKNITKGKVGNTTITFYPTAGQNAPVDGGLTKSQNPSGASWTTLRDATAATTVYDAVDSPGHFNAVQIYDGGAGAWNAISRSILGFDTSSLGSATIDSATLSIHGNNKTDGYSGADVVIDRTTPASSSALSTSDYDVTQWDETLQSNTRITIASWDNTGYNHFPLNSTGEGNINSSGYSWFGLRHGMDFDDSEPTKAKKNSRIITRFVEAAGTTVDPMLVVEITAAPSVGTTSASIFYDYDAVGNIIKITDTDGSASTSVLYTYDDLYRLTGASTTPHSSTTYTRSYGYNSLGNITNKSDIGSYAYNGHTGSDYANPHAATAINSVGLTYDENGNLLTYGQDTYTWDYANRLAEFGDGVSTSTFAYDHAGQRVKKASESASTTYPSPLYEVSGATTTKHIYAGDMVVATINTADGSSVTRYNHVDHLGSTRLVSDVGSNIDQALSYYPFGDTLSDTKAGSFNQDRQFTGHTKDGGTGLIYMKARYYDPVTGRFSSIDPYVFKDLSTIINDPQLLNTYGYARNNPLKYDDPNGELPVLVVTGVIGGLVGLAALGAADLVSIAAGGDVSQPSAYAGAAVGGFVVGSGVALVGTLAGGAGVAATAGTIAAGGTGTVVGDLVDQSLDGQPFSAQQNQRAATFGLAGGLAGVAAPKLIGAADDLVGATTKSFSIQGINAGRGSWEHVSNTTLGRLQSGDISNISAQTAAKMFGVEFMENGFSETTAQIIDKATRDKDLQ
ncbi:MAG: FG-GAP-like repeat-containing protein [Alphaproteobacteria bacterium]|nr:FG-GAP-like repeat-containing protein [Alphaproteobacteria bacterium]